MKQFKRAALILVTIGLMATVLVNASACAAVRASVVDEKQLVEVRPGQLLVSVQADGNVSLPHQRKLYFEVPGTIVELAVKKGESVKKGQLIARLDNKDQVLAVDIARADVTLAENNFALRNPCAPFLPGGYAYADLPGVSDTLNILKGELAQAVAALQTQDYVTASSQLSLAQDDVERAKSVLNEKYINTYANGIDQATFNQYTLQLQKANLALKKAKQDLQKTEIYAPFDGVIAAVPVKEGDAISGSSYATAYVVQLIDPTVIEVEGLLDEVDRPMVSIGQEVVVSVDALPRTLFSARVTFVSDVADNRSGVVNYDFTVQIEQPLQSGLKEGMSATAKVVQQKQNDVLLVPETVIKDLRTQPWVQVLRDGKMERRDVKVGRTDGKNWEILSGLETGDKVSA
jgi:RND family efflux transporter MFP subunit